MMKRFDCIPGAALCAALITATGLLTELAPRANAASVAADDASNYSSFGTYSASNLGSGFGAWTLTGDDGISSNEGSYLSTASAGGISTSTKAWGVYANSAHVMECKRAFTGSLSVGQVFQMDIASAGAGQNVSAHSTPPGSISWQQFGFELRSGTTARWRIYFRGGQSNLEIDDHAGNQISIGAGGFPSGGFRVCFRLISADTYEFAILSPNTGTIVYASGTRTLMGTSGTGIDGVDFYNNSANSGSPAGGDAFFNSMKIGYAYPSISSQPASTTTTCSGATTPAMAVTASSTDGSTLSYAWRKRGTGWGNSWIMNANGGNIFLASSSDIDTGGKSWGLQQTTAGTPTEAIRSLPGTLAANQTLSIDVENKNVASGGTVGLSLQDTGGNNAFEFYFAGGASNYSINDSSGSSRNTGLPFTSTGLHLNFTLTSATAYSLTLRRLSDGATLTLTGSVISSRSIQRIRLFDSASGGGNNVYFNSLVVEGADDNASNYSSWSGDQGQKPLANGATGNGGTYAGTATSSFTITAPGTGDSGSFDCAVMSGQGYTTISSATALTVNSATATNFTHNANKGAAFKMQESEALGNASGTGGVTLTSVSSTSANGVSVTRGGGYIFYNSPVTNNDSFTFTVASVTGGCAATATITVNMLNPPGPAQISMPSNGMVTIKFFGIPGYTYIVQGATNAGGPWAPMSTNTAGSDGSWIFTDNNATAPQQYYRMAIP
jgi:hypothetical protein